MGGGGHHALSGEKGMNSIGNRLPLFLFLLGALLPLALLSGPLGERGLLEMQVAELRTKRQELQARLSQLEALRREVAALERRLSNAQPFQALDPGWLAGFLKESGVRVKAVSLGEETTLAPGLAGRKVSVTLSPTPFSDLWKALSVLKERGINPTQARLEAEGEGQVSGNLVLVLPSGKGGNREVPSQAGETP